MVASSWVLSATNQEAGELAGLPLLERIEQLLRLAVEQRIYWGEMGNLEAVSDDSVFRRFVFADQEPHPDFQVVDGQEDGRRDGRVFFRFRASGDPDLMLAFADLAGKEGKIETNPW